MGGRGDGVMWWVEEGGGIKRGDAIRRSCWIAHLSFGMEVTGVWKWVGGWLTWAKEVAGEQEESQGGVGGGLVQGASVADGGGRVLCGSAKGTQW